MNRVVLRSHGGHQALLARPFDMLWPASIGWMILTRIKLELDSSLKSIRLAIVSWIFILFIWWIFNMAAQLSKLLGLSDRDISALPSLCRLTTGFQNVYGALELA
jgi:hypothetical protein